MVILRDAISVVAVLCHEYITAEPETHNGGRRWCIREDGYGRWLIGAVVLEWWMRIADAMVVVDEVDPLVPMGQKHEAQRNMPHVADILLKSR